MLGLAWPPSKPSRSTSIASPSRRRRYGANLRQAAGGRTRLPIMEPGDTLAVGEKVWLINYRKPRGGKVDDGYPLSRGAAS
jgi:hypothetical protein